MTERLRDWQSRLQALLAERRAQPFVWGQHDCCLFVADAVQAMTGVDPVPAYRGYSSEREAVRLVKKLGGMATLIARFAGEQIPPQMACVGDVGLVTVGGRESAALCAGIHWIAPGPVRLETLPMSAATMAWRCC